MDIQNLLGFGMTPVEAAAFNEVLNQKEATISQISKNANLHRGTAYNVLENLIKKGFLVSKITDKGKKYSVSGISRFSVLLEDTRKKLKSDEEVIQQIANEIEQKNKGKAEKEEILIYRGKEGYETFYKGMVQECLKNKERFYSMGMGGTTIETFGLAFFKMLQKYKKTKGLKPLVILDKKMKMKKYEKIVHGNVRYINFPYPVPTTTRIFSDKVSFSLWESKPPTTIVIKSSEFNKSYRNSFEILWDLIEKEQKYLDKVHKLNIYEFVMPAEESLDIMSICGLEQVHEGREKIIELLKNGKKVRILISNPAARSFKERVMQEEQYLDNIHESRILYELKATIASLKDIKARLKHCGKASDNLKVRIFDKPPVYTIISVDDNKTLYNHYGTKKGEYGGAKRVYILEKGEDDFDKAKKVYETYWESAKPLKF